MTSTIASKRIQISLLILLGLTVSALTSCGIIQGDTNHNNAVVVTPAKADVRAGDTLQFSAQVSGSGSGSLPVPPPPPARRMDRDGGDRKNFAAKGQPQTDAPVQWAVDGISGGNATVGTISASGLYTAPAILPNPGSAQITATNPMDQSSGDAAITLQNPVPVVQSVQPDPVTVGAFTLTVNGSKFVKGAQV